MNLKFVAEDRNQLFLEVEDVEAGDFQGEAGDLQGVAGDLQGVAEDLQGVGVASGAEGDFRNIALPISCCHYSWMLLGSYIVSEKSQFHAGFRGDMWFYGCS